jgi:hypothetical protein
VVISHIDRQLIDEEIVRIAIAPILSRLIGFNHRVTGRMGVLGGVLVL